MKAHAVFKEMITLTIILRFLSHEKHVCVNYCSSNYLPPVSAFTGWGIPFPLYLLFKYLMDFLTTLVGTLFRFPKAFFIGVKATSPLSTFICHFWHPLTHPLPLWAICNEIVNTIWIQNPSLPHIASYQLCGLGNSLNSLSLSFLPIKCGYYNACFIELSEIVHAKCLKPAKHAICFSRFYCRTLKKISGVSPWMSSEALCVPEDSYSCPPPLFQALFSNLSPQPSIV